MSAASNALARAVHRPPPRSSVQPAPALTAIPLVRRMLDDPSVTLVERAIDRTWTYERAIPVSTVGFNPFRQEIHYGAISRMATWLRNPDGPARELNDRDLLVREVLFAVHDYLHCWAVRAVIELAPQLDFSTGPIAERYEDYVFCHLLTEAVATVGLDYWYLSQRELNRVCDLGSAVRCLTTSYREADASEYRRFDPGFSVARPGFFADMATFYCTGEWTGFDAEDLRRSAMLRRWLEHELSYGSTQREYTRMWLSYLAGAEPPRSRLAAPVAHDAPWQTQLIDSLGAMLWQLVVDDDPPALSATVDPDDTWRSPGPRLDYRFVNVNALSDGESAIGLDDAPKKSTAYLCHQLLSQHSFAKTERPIRLALAALAREGNAALIGLLLAGRDRLPARDEPRDLLFLN